MITSFQYTATNIIGYDFILRSFEANGKIALINSGFVLIDILFFIFIIYFHLYQHVP